MRFNASDSLCYKLPPVLQKGSQQIVVGLFCANFASDILSLSPLSVDSSQELDQLYHDTIISLSPLIYPV